MKSRRGQKLRGKCMAFSGKGSKNWKSLEGVREKKGKKWG